MIALPADSRRPPPDALPSAGRRPAPRRRGRAPRYPASLLLTVLSLAATHDASAQPPRELQPDQTVSAALDGGGPDAGDGRWRFQGQQGQLLVISVTSDDFDPAVRLLDSTGAELADDDDSGPGLNARLTTILPDDGMYDIVVTAVDILPTAGAYRITLHAPRPRQLDFGISRPDSLDPDLPHVWHFDAAAGDVVTIAVDSEDFDPAVRLLDSTGAELADDDDSGPGLNARLTTTLPETGRYLLLPRTIGILEPADAGAYSIRLDRTTVDPDDGAWTFDALGGQLLSVSVRSASFDPAVRVIDPNGQSVPLVIPAADDPDYPLTPPSLWIATASTAGRHTLLVTGGQGAYDLAVRNVPLDAIRLDSEADGELSSAVPVLAWRFSADAGVPLHITARSEHFDTVLQILSPDGLQLARNDDRGPGSLDSLVSMTAPRTGDYHILVSAVSAGVGPFVLELRRPTVRALDLDASVVGVLR